MINEPNIESLEAMLARAIDDGAAVQYPTLEILLSQLRGDIRLAVAQAFEKYRPFHPGSVFYIAHLRTDINPDGLWGTTYSTGQVSGYGLLVCSSERRYQEQIQKIRAGLSTQEERP